MIGNLLGNSATLELLHQPSAVHILSVTKNESKFQTDRETEGTKNLESQRPNIYNDYNHHKLKSYRNETTKL